MQDAKWVYHLTRKNIALMIKKGGMTSALTRTGMAVANANGAFVQDRKKKEPQEFQKKLRAYLADLLSRGCPEETIKRTKGVYVPFNFVPQGSNKADIPRLDRLEKEYLDRYRQLFQNLGNFDGGKALRLVKSREVAQTAELMLLNDKNHFLVRLAIQYAHHRYNIEEMITASHIYFLKPGDAATGYKDYKKHLGDVTIVVLRVHKGNLPGLVQDDSEGRAMMTHITVTPDVIEVMVNHDNFPDEDYRSNDQNWQPLRNLV